MIQNLTAIVLRSRSFTEKDLILNVLSDNGERMELLVKGAGGPRSRRRTHLEGMNLIRGVVYHSRNHRYLQNLHTECSFPRLKEHVDRVFRLAIFLEILEKSLPLGTRHPEIYALLLATLRELNQEKANPFLPEMALIKLAHQLGYLPSFKHCGHCHRGIKEEAHWNPEGRTLACPSCRKTEDQFLPFKYRKAFEFFRHASPRDYQKITLLPEEEKTIREWIPTLLGTELDKTLKSWQVYLTLQTSLF